MNINLIDELCKALARELITSGEMPKDEILINRLNRLFSQLNLTIKDIKKYKENCINEKIQN